MSKLIDNQTQQKEALKQIIQRLHEGEEPDALKVQFRDLLDKAGATEIAELESELISAGLPEEEVRRLCDVHVAIFEDALASQAKPDTLPGHPVHTFRLENDAVASVLDDVRAAARQLSEAGDPDARRRALAGLRDGFDAMREMEKHYLRKEHLLFPYLEQYGIQGPSSVMWAIHDDIRAAWKDLSALLASALTEEGAYRTIAAKLPPLIETMSSMAYKEENILFPMALERLTHEQWLAIKQQSAEIGYAGVQPGDEWPVDLNRLVAEQELGSRPAPDQSAADALADGLVHLDTGVLSRQELNLMLTHLPLDITFVDKDDTVRYFSAGRDRIFIRTETVIGRKVQNCHPPKSMHVVEQILSDFKSGKREHADFWIPFGDKLVHIRYLAVRDEVGSYVGTLEVTQDIAPLRELEGERRLLSD